MSWRNDYTLRPIEQADLALVRQWRNSDHIRKQMYTDHIISEEEHQRWFDEVTETKRTLHYIFEFQKEPLGVVNLVEIDNLHKRCHWGFYIGNPEAPRGSGSAMGFFALEHAFEKLQFNRIIGEAISTNTDSIKYHKRLGFVEEGCLKDHAFKDGAFQDVITLGVLRRYWDTIKSELVGKFFERNGK